MRKTTVAIMTSALTFTVFACQAEDVAKGGNQHPVAEIQIQRNSDGGVVQNHMFDGINLTEHQRQQMRDLMQRARQHLPPIDVSEMETMHQLVIADQFDENAVRAQAEKMAQEQVARQVEMAKVRNRMYHLLTSEQQTALNKIHQQRMREIRELAQESASLQLTGRRTVSNQ